MQGRKPQPVEMQIAKGDPRKRGVGKLQEKLSSQPIAEKGLPKCPSHLKRRARRAWNFWKEGLEGMNLDARPDAQMLEMACASYAMATESYVALQKEGVRVSIPIFSRKGDHVGDKDVANPMVAIHNAAARNVKAFCSEFGLSPVSRTRLSIDKQEDGMAELEAILKGPRLSAEEGKRAMQ